MEQHGERNRADADGGHEIIHIGPIDAPEAIGARVRDMTAKVRRITTTDEGKLQVVLEAEGMDDRTIAQVKEMLVLQQTCLVKVSMTPVQRDLFDA